MIPCENFFNESREIPSKNQERNVSLSPNIWAKERDNLLKSDAWNSACSNPQSKEKLRQHARGIVAGTFLDQSTSWRLCIDLAEEK